MENNRKNLESRQYRMRVSQLSYQDTWALIMRLPKKERNVLHLINRLSQSHLEVFPSYCTIARALNCCEKTVQRLIYSLLDKGFLYIRHRPRQSNLYKLPDVIKSLGFYKRFAALLCLGSFGLAKNVLVLNINVNLTKPPVTVSYTLPIEKESPFKKVSVSSKHPPEKETRMNKLLAEVAGLSTSEQEELLARYDKESISYAVKELTKQMSRQPIRNPFAYLKTLAGKTIEQRTYQNKPGVNHQTVSVGIMKRTVQGPTEHELQRGERNQNEVFRLQVEGRREYQELMKKNGLSTKTPFDQQPQSAGMTALKWLWALRDGQLELNKQPTDEPRSITTNETQPTKATVPNIVDGCPIGDYEDPFR